MSAEVLHNCICGEASKIWVPDEEQSKPCSGCGRVYQGVYDEETSAMNITECIEERWYKCDGCGMMNKYESNECNDCGDGICFYCESHISGLCNDCFNRKEEDEDET